MQNPGGMLALGIEMHKMTYRGNLADHPIAPETGRQAYTRIRLAQSSELELKANTRYSASLSFLGCPMRPTSSWVNERSSQYLIHLVKLTNIQPRNNIIKNNKKKKHKKKKNQKYIYTNTNNRSDILKSVKLI